jgi:hypothetical protein
VCRCFPIVSPPFLLFFFFIGFCRRQPFPTTPLALLLLADASSCFMCVCVWFFRSVCVDCEGSVCWFPRSSFGMTSLRWFGALLRLHFDFICGSFSPLFDSGGIHFSALVFIRSGCTLHCLSLCCAVHAAFRFCRPPRCLPRLTRCR